MSALPKPKLTALQYLAIERRAEFKSEFFDGEMFAMAGASSRHVFIASNLGLRLANALLGGPCRVGLSDLRVLVDRTGLYTYPDIVVVCGPVEYAPNDPDTLVNPTAIIEVLSPSTEKYDRGAKFRNYKRIESLMEYVLVAQDEPLCERYVRQSDGAWGVVAYEGLHESLIFTSIPATVPLAEIYSGVEFPATPTA